MKPDMILSASGWRKVFAISGDEQDHTTEINEQDNAIATISDFTDEMQVRVQNLKEKLSTAEQALESVKTIAIQNTESVEKLNLYFLIRI